jgi:hypothetical protein
MKSSRAPDGYHTDVRIKITLENGYESEHLWDTPMGLAQAAHKALGWAKDEMTNTQIPGRSKIVGFTTTVRYRPGDYENIK